MEEMLFDLFQDGSSVWSAMKDWQRQRWIDKAESLKAEGFIHKSEIDKQCTCCSEDVAKTVRAKYYCPRCSGQVGRPIDYIPKSEMSERVK